MKNSVHSSLSNQEKSPILIIDKEGKLGIYLAKKLSEDGLVIFATRKRLSKNESENIITVPFSRRFPNIPDNVYSQIFLIDENNNTESFLPSLLKKSSVDGVNIFYITRSSDITEKKAIKISELSSKVFLFLLGDVFDDFETFKSVSPINTYIKNIRDNMHIKISGDGLNLSFPVYIDDVAETLCRNIGGHISKVNYVMPSHPITDLSLSRLFKRNNPDLKIDFDNHKSKQQTYYIGESANFLLGSKYDLENRIKNLDFEQNPAEYNEEVVEEGSVNRSYFLPFLWIFFFCLFFLFLPLLTTLSYSLLATTELNSAKNSLIKGDLVSAQRKAENSKTFFDIAKKTAGPMLTEAKMLGQEKVARNLLKKVELGSEVSTASIYLVESVSMIKNVSSGKSGDPAGDFREASNLLQNSISALRRAEADGNIPGDLKNELNDVNTLVDLISGSAYHFPKIFGFEGEKKYLILFQNNMELRPGGGFIGSYGTVKLNKGKIEDFKIYDVYSADGQLRGHVEPEYPLRRYLPTAHLYLRDSNFGLSFSQNASSAARLLNLSLNEKVDGVIGVDLSLVQNILREIGPVKVADYKETVTEENLFLLTEEKAEKGFFPGSTQKKDFLKSLYNSILFVLTSKRSIPYFALAKSVSSSVDEKHLMFSFDDSVIQNTFSVNGWGGVMRDERAEASNKINDFLGINEANLGVNKVNYFISRSISKQLTINENGKVVSSVTIVFKNNSKSGQWPGGGYKNYLRIITPTNTSLEGIIIDGKKQEITDAIVNPLVYERQNFTPPSGLEVEEFEDQEKKVVGFLINIPPNSLKTVKLNYKFEKRINLKNKTFDYSLLYYKQPGVERIPVDLSITYPNKIFLTSKPEEFKDSENKTFGSLSLVKDERIDFSFSQR